MWWTILGPFLVSLTGSILGRVLVCLGMGFMSFAVFNTLAQNFVDAINAQVGGMSSDVLNILYLAGFGQLLSILCSAFLTRASLMAVTKVTSMSAADLGSGVWLPPGRLS